MTATRVWVEGLGPCDVRFWVSIVTFPGFWAKYTASRTFGFFVSFSTSPATYDASGPHGLHDSEAQCHITNVVKKAESLRGRCK